jgi:hypothetical protein
VTRMCSPLVIILAREYLLVRVEGSVPWRPRIDYRCEPAKGIE